MSSCRMVTIQQFVPQKCNSHTSQAITRYSNLTRFSTCKSFQGLLCYKQQLNQYGIYYWNWKERLNVALSSRNPNWVRIESEADPSKGSQGIDFIVVNFYHFVPIEDPETEVSRHLSFIEYSGPSDDALAYVAWVKEDCRFSDILVQISPAINGHAFPRLKLRYKPSLVQMEGGISHLPLLDPSMRATPLTPSQWRKKLEAVNGFDIVSNADLRTSCILLDVRNGYEWDIGHFQGAQRPDVDCFRSTSFGLSESEATSSDPLANADREKTDILMYCTGGIRCDVYSAILRQQGFKRLYTLKGGISHYLESEGSVGWVGNLFVFDSRLSLPPSTYKPGIETEATKKPNCAQDTSFAKCHICGSQVSELKHRNCANIDCNLLFLCCRGCVTDLRGCCRLKCTSASRLRPVLSGPQRYKKWHHYRDQELLTQPIKAYGSR